MASTKLAFVFEGLDGDDCNAKHTSPGREATLGSSSRTRKSCSASRHSQAARPVVFHILDRLVLFHNHLDLLSRRLTMQICPGVYLCDTSTPHPFTSFRAGSGALPLWTPFFSGTSDELCLIVVVLAVVIPSAGAYQGHESARPQALDGVTVIGLFHQKQILLTA